MIASSQYYRSHTNQFYISIARYTEPGTIFETIRHVYLFSPLHWALQELEKRLSQNGGVKQERGLPYAGIIGIQTRKKSTRSQA